ncbi:MAG: tRNA pseudouridine(38-40) synthase TruA [Salibacteraceae bacterium]
MQRYFIKLAYNGKPFKGWQIQPNHPTVQEELEIALTTVLRNKTAVVGCGRTDSGVHASQYYAHFDTNKEFNEAELRFKLNCMISKEVAISEIFKVSNDLHARFSAESRTYHYFINHSKNAFNHEFSWFMHQPLSVDLMNAACKELLGTQDFTSFSKLHTQTNTNICTIAEAFWENDGLGFKFTITADRFLHNMVRAIVGTCIQVGRGKLSREGFKEIIDSKSRQNAGASVPGHGLFLAKIRYPEF